MVFLFVTSVVQTAMIFLDSVLNQRMAFSMFIWDLVSLDWLFARNRINFPLVISLMTLFAGFLAIYQSVIFQRILKRMECVDWS